MVPSSFAIPWTQIVVGVAALIVLLVILKSVRYIGNYEVGLITKRFGKKLEGGNPVAFQGEAGYQAELLMPGFRFKIWPIFSVKNYPWVQVPAGEIGIVVAQVGEPLPIGAKTAVYKTGFGRFSDLTAFVQNGGQKGIQRPALNPGETLPIHPVAFLVITKEKVYGLPVSPELQDQARSENGLTHKAFGLDDPALLDVTQIEPARDERTGETYDRIGIVETRDGPPLEKNDIVGRLGGFEDVAKNEDDVKHQRRPSHRNGPWQPKQPTQQLSRLPGLP